MLDIVFDGIASCATPTTRSPLISLAAGQAADRSPRHGRSVPENGARWGRCWDGSPFRFGERIVEICSSSVWSRRTETAATGRPG